MRAEIAGVVAHDGAGAGEHDRAAVGADLIAAQQERAAGPMLPRAPGPGVEQARELHVHLVEIADGDLVEDHDIRRESLQPPVLLRLQDLAHEVRALARQQAHDDDRKIARDAVGPEAGLTEAVRREQAGIRAERSIEAEHARGQAIEQHRVGVRDVERHERVSVRG